MSSVSTTSSGLSNLLQTLRAESPELSSLLSMPKVKSALEKASPGDLVELSDQALQLQQVGLLFGASDGTQSTGLSSVSDPLFSILGSGVTDTQPDPLIQALEASLGVTSSSSASTGMSLTDQIANSQLQQVKALFGTAPAVPSLLNTLG